MWGLIVRYGILGGLIVGVPMMWRMFSIDAKAPPSDPFGGLLLGYTIMLVALTTVFLGVKRYRDRVKGGVIRFLPAFGVGLGISVVACLIYVFAWEISLRFSDYDFIAAYSNGMIEAAKAQGSPEAIAKAAADARTFADMYAQPLIRMPMTFVEMFPVGLLVSLISAAVLRNSRILPSKTPG